MTLDKARSTIITICGSASAVGKSTLVTRLGQLIPDSVTFFFDAYQETTVYPPNLYQDLADGKEVDVKLIESPVFFRDLKALAYGAEVTDAWNRRLQPAKYIILEEPFGRNRIGMADLIDFVGCIELPLDTALARRLLRNLRHDFTHLPIDERVQYVEDFLEEYLRGGRISYLKMFEAVAPDCDILLDGLQSTDEMAQQVIDKLIALNLLEPAASPQARL
ncbi:hypothetical protein [Paenibacillus sp. NPDC058174]|uniref:hypothetical protein n=1 Tax=Paenibacillus sp. NPDC058174 TaxID=3346366 RepID=UPI0036DB5EAB